MYNDGEKIETDKPCESCYCMRGDIVCAVRSCGTPLQGKDCEPLPPPEGECCPTTYKCGMHYYKEYYISITENLHNIISNSSQNQIGI